MLLLLLAAAARAGCRGDSPAAEARGGGEGRTGGAQPRPHIPSAEASPPLRELPPLREMPVGLAEDYPEETRSLDVVARDLDVLRAAGVRLLRVAIGWDGTEPRRGTRDWTFWDGVFRLAEERGVTLLPYVCYTPEWAAPRGRREPWTAPPRDVRDFASFVGEAAARYRGRARSWELWNEPDNAQYWTGTPAEFAALLRAGAAAVRAADPGARVVFGGIAHDLGFLDAVLEEHGAAPHVDVVNLHNYYETWSDDPVERLDEYVGRAAEIAARHGGKPLWMAELGYSSQRRGGTVSDWYEARFAGEHTPRAQAVALWRALATLRATERIELATWYRVTDLPANERVIGDLNNRFLGVVATDRRPKPSLAALAFYQATLGGPVRVLDGIARVTRAIESDAEVHVFQRADGGLVVAGWLRTRTFGAARGGAGDARDERVERVTVRLPFGVEDARAFDETGAPLVAPREASGGPPAGAPGGDAFRAAREGELDLTLRGTAVTVVTARAGRRSPS